MLRALHEWILDNECTPYILVNALAENVEVPQQFVKNGQIVLNVSPMAVSGFSLTNEVMQFSGRFGGISMDVFVPMAAVMGIYSRENGQGMMFDPDDDPKPDPPSGKGLKEVSGKVSSAKSSDVVSIKKPSLKVVK
ncbi:MAG: stringent starvation protein B [Gammaproteobacteria bacterium]|jgi:stringent starvation protein B